MNTEDKIWTREDLEDYYDRHPRTDVHIERYLQNRFNLQHIAKLFKRFEEYQPKDKVKLLLIGESPPKARTYFYIPSNSKFKNGKGENLNITDRICVGFFGEHWYKRNLIETSLERLRDEYKFCLVDLSLETPLNDKNAFPTNEDRANYLVEYPHILDDFKNRINALPSKIEEMDIRLGLPARTVQAFKKDKNSHQVWLDLTNFLQLDRKHQFKKDYEWHFNKIGSSIIEYWEYTKY